MTTATLQQGSPEWHAARKGKLTASNVGAALGLCSWTSRKVAYERAIGTDTFEGNEATRWGTDNEPNALAAYSAHTGTTSSSRPACTYTRTHPGSRARRTG